MLVDLLLPVVTVVTAGDATAATVLEIPSTEQLVFLMTGVGLMKKSWRTPSCGFFTIKAHWKSFNVKQQQQEILR